MFVIDALFFFSLFFMRLVHSAIEVLNVATIWVENVSPYFDLPIPAFSTLKRLQLDSADYYERETLGQIMVLQSMR